MHSCHSGPRYGFGHKRCRLSHAHWMPQNPSVILAGDRSLCPRWESWISLVLYDKFTLSLKTTEKEVAQLILNKDEKCIRQEILKFLTDDEIVAEVKPSEKCNGSFDLQCQCSMCKCCSICRKKSPCPVKKTWSLTSTNF